MTSCHTSKSSTCATEWPTRKQEAWACCGVRKGRPGNRSNHRGTTPTTRMPQKKKFTPEAGQALGRRSAHQHPAKERVMAEKQEMRRINVNVRTELAPHATPRPHRRGRQNHPFHRRGSDRFPFEQMFKRRPGAPQCPIQPESPRPAESETGAVHLTKF